MMITGKIILKSATKLTLDQRFSEISKQAPPVPRTQQQTNVIIPQSRRELFGNQRSATLSIANRLKKRSINYRLGLANKMPMTRQNRNLRKSNIFQRLSFGNSRLGGGANSYLFGGQSGMGVRLRGQGRIGTRVFRSRTRGFLNNNTISRFNGFSRRGNQNNKNQRGRRFGMRSNRGRSNGNRNFNNRNARNRNQRKTNNNNFTKESLDNELESYMAQTKIDTDSMA